MCVKGFHLVWPNDYLLASEILAEVSYVESIKYLVGKDQTFFFFKLSCFSQIRIQKKGVDTQ